MSDEDEFYDAPWTFTGCTCTHTPAEHTFGECQAEGCPCEGGWEE